MYGKGQGVPKDLADVYKWTREAADQGLAPAQLSVGLAYIGGDAVSQDLRKAAEWLRRAADQGLAEAQKHLDDIIEVLAVGVEAAKWYRKAAELGNADAQRKVAEFCASGECVCKDLVEAYKWFTLAAAGDNSSLSQLDIQAGAMTSAQIAEAQRLAREQKRGERPELRAMDHRCARESRT